MNTYPTRCPGGNHRWNFLTDKCEVCQMHRSAYEDQQAARERKKTVAPAGGRRW